MTDTTIRDDSRSSEEVSILGIGLILLRRRTLVLSLAVLPVLTVLVLHWTTRSEFIATSTVVSDGSESALGSYAGIAAQLGVALPSGDGGASLGFYSALVASPTLLKEVVTASYAVPNSDGRARESTLVEEYDIEGDTEHERILKATTQLQENLAVSEDLDAGTFTIEVRAHHPALAVQINDRLVERLIAFDTQRRQGQATAQREFIEARRTEARASLLAAEGMLENFLQQNRTYQSSPQLSFEAARLERAVELAQQVYTSLAQSFEQARIEEIRDSSPLSVVTPARDTVRPAGGFVVQLILAAVLGLVVGIGAAFAVEFIVRERARYPSAYGQLKAELRRSLHKA